MSRIIEKRRLLGTREKEFLRKTMRKLEIFCGVDILTYTILDSHWHILIHVPQRREVSDQELLRRLGALYPQYQVDQVALMLRDYRQGGEHRAAEALKAGYTYRMYDLAQFFKAFKQRFTQYYNTRRCRVRYFTDGLVLGNREFVERVFEKHRDRFGLKRSSGARPMKHGQWQGLCTMRDLRIDPVSIG
jgi:hypothetical protein